MGGSYSSTEPGIPQAAQGAWNNFTNITKGLQASAGQYPGQTGYTGPKNLTMTPEQTAGLGKINAWAMGAPTPLENGATDMLTRTMQGQYLDPAQNPFLQKTTDALMENMSKAIGQNSQDLGDVFSKMGVTYRGPAEQKMRTAALSDFSNAMTGLYGNAYNQERGNMMSAAPQAMSWANLPGEKGQALLSAGGTANDIASGNRTFNYNDYLNTLGNQQNAFMLPWQLQNQLMSSMPLAYPQQTYSKGFLDYAGDILGQ